MQIIIFRYFELSVHIEQFEVDEELLENALRKFLILPPILLSDLQTLIVVMKLLHFLLQRSMYINMKINSIRYIISFIVQCLRHIILKIVEFYVFFFQAKKLN